MLPLFILAITGASWSADVTESQNIIWDGGFESGYGNGCWGAASNGKSYNRYIDWVEGGSEGKRCVRVGDFTAIASRIYKLGNGPAVFRFSFSAKTEDETKQGFLSARVSNQNYYRYRKKNILSKNFTVDGAEWKRYSFDVEIKDPFRPYFHLEFHAIRSKENVLIDAVSLIKITEENKSSKAEFKPHQKVSTGFIIPDDTHMFLDGEKREVYFVVHNYSNAKEKVDARYEVRDFREKVVIYKVLPLELEPGETKRIAIDVDMLRYGGYRLSSSCKVGKELGDMLFAILPRVDHTVTPRFGANVTYRPESYPFAIKYMKKLSMGYVSTVSTGEILANWPSVEPQEGKFVWQDKMVDALVEADIWPLVYFNMFGRKNPKWVGFKSKDKEAEARQIEKFNTYVKTYIKRYGKKIKFYTLDDELEHKKDYKKNLGHVVEAYKQAYDSAHQAAKEAGTEINMTINALGWPTLLKSIPVKYFDFYSQNSIHQVASTTRLLTDLQKYKAKADHLFVPAVGQQGPLRATSMIVDRPPKGGCLAGTQAAQVIQNLWLSKPFSEKDKKGSLSPYIHYGFYEIRFGAQNLFRPVAGWSGMSFDNSPDLAFQAVTTMRHLLLKLMPLRENTNYSTSGLPAGTIKAYPFRNEEKAVVALLASPLDHPYKLSLPQTKGTFYDLFANKIRAGKDGMIEAKEFPVYFACASDDLDKFLKELPTWKVEKQKTADKYELAAGGYILNADIAARKFNFSIQDGDNKTPVIDNFSLSPETEKFSCNAKAGTAFSTSKLKTAKGDLTFQLTKEKMAATFVARSGGKLHITLNEGTCVNQNFTWMLNGSGYKGKLAGDFGQPIEKLGDIKKEGHKGILFQVGELFTMSVDLPRSLFSPEEAVFVVKDGQAQIILGQKSGRSARISFTK
jgi:hypothetical protein